MSVFISSSDRGIFRSLIDFVERERESNGLILNCSRMMNFVLYFGSD